MKLPKLIYLRPGDAENVSDRLPPPAERFPGDAFLFVGDPSYPRIDRCILVVVVQEKAKDGTVIFGSLGLMVKQGSDVDAFGLLIADLAQRVAALEDRSRGAPALAQILGRKPSAADPS